MPSIIKNLICLLVISCFAVSCAKKPVLYDNAKYKQVGKSGAEKNIEECMKKAKEAGAKGEGKLATSGYNAARGAAGGAAGGAIAGTIYNGKVGRGLGAGAAGGAASSFIYSMMGREPDPIFRNYVNTCLAERGFKTIGWN
jgi:hypothetical protein